MKNTAKFQRECFVGSNDTQNLLEMSYLTASSVLCKSDLIDLPPSSATREISDGNFATNVH